MEVLKGYIGRSFEYVEKRGNEEETLPSFL
jgi:hypothetical protein